MDLLKQFLKRFEHLKDPKHDRILVAEAISSVLGSTIAESQITIQKNKVALSGISPIVRNLVFMRREEILLKIKESCPKLYIENIG